MTIHQRTSTKQQGISLIELMISLTLSALLMLGVMRMFTDSTTNNLADTALAQVQDSGRMAIELLKRDIRMAGFQGGISRLQPPVANSIVNLASQQVVEIIDGGNVATSSDQLRIRRAFDTGSKITAFYNDNQRIAVSPAVCARNNNDVFVATDGQNLASFRFSQASDCTTGNTLDTAAPVGTNNNSVNLQNFSIASTCTAASIDNCPSLYRFDSDNGSLYSIQPRKNPDGSDALGSDNRPIMALYLNGTEMIEGIENLQVLYGIAAPNGTVKYMKGCAPPCTITNTGEEITHLKLSLVVASTFPVSHQNRQQSYSVFNLNTDKSVYQTNDRRLRRVFTSTVQLRNRG